MIAGRKCRHSNKGWEAIQDEMRENYKAVGRFQTQPGLVIIFVANQVASRLLAKLIESAARL